MSNKLQSHLAYGFLAPALIVMLLCGVLPMAFVAFYSVHDTFAGDSFIWVGLDWYRRNLVSPEFFAALERSLSFSVIALLIEVPLGIYIALRIPAKGLMSSLYIVLMAIPLLTPYIVVGHLWQALTLPHAGLLYEAARWLGLNYNMNNIVVAWLTLALMDTWHWTSLVALLCFAGLQAIPEDYYRAARIDGASGWAIFRHIQLPKAAARAAHCNTPALHGQLHDLYGGLCCNPRRAWSFDRVPVARAGANRHRRVQSR